MESKYLVVFATLCLSIVVPACAQQSITDMEKCEKLSLPCGRDDVGYSQKYCCFELNGRFPIHTCCNPYIGLAVGLSVGVPLLIAIIVGIIVAYCLCARYQNKKMDRLMFAYRQAQLEEEEEESTEPVNPAAPPPYTPVSSSDKNDPDAGLPVYTESDPFATATNTDSSTDTAEPQSQPPTQPSSEEAQLDDVPLITDDEEETS